MKILLFLLILFNSFFIFTVNSIVSPYNIPIYVVLLVPILYLTFKIFLFGDDSIYWIKRMLKYNSNMKLKFGRHELTLEEWLCLEKYFTEHNLDYYAYCDRSRNTIYFSSLDVISTEDIDIVYKKVIKGE